MLQNQKATSPDFQLNIELASPLNLQPVLEVRSVQLGWGWA